MLRKDQVPADIGRRGQLSAFCGAKQCFFGRSIATDSLV